MAVYVPVSKADEVREAPVVEETVEETVEEATEEEIQFMIDNKLDADLRWDCVRKKLVERLHNAGLKVNCWTVDDPAWAEKLVAMGVDYITTNILE